MIALLIPRSFTGADFEPDGRGWNGLSELISLAREQGLAVQAPQRIDLSELSPRDGLLLIHPTSSLPRADLIAFMREGGRLGLADDFGRGGELLEVFRIGRGPPQRVEHGRRLRDNRNVVIAQPHTRHPLSQDVAALVLNHPQTLYHDALQPIFTLGGDGQSVVLAGAVGAGRLVSLSDSSALINNMLEFRGNRTFAENLVRYLAQDQRLLICAARCALVEGYGDSGRSLPESLSRFASPVLPPRAVALLTLGVASLLLFVAATSLPRRSSYLRAVTPAAPEVAAGFAGRVELFADERRNLLSPALSYKLALEAELARGLGIRGQPGLQEVLDSLRARGVAEPVVEDARALLVELDQLKLAHERPAPPPVVRRRKFRHIIARGERILAALKPLEATRDGDVG